MTSFSFHPILSTSGISIINVHQSIFFNCEGVYLQNYHYWYDMHHQIPHHIVPHSVQQPWICFINTVYFLAWSFTFDEVEGINDDSEHAAGQHHPILQSKNPELVPSKSINEEVKHQHQKNIGCIYHVHFGLVFPTLLKITQYN